MFGNLIRGFLFQNWMIIGQAESVWCAFEVSVYGLQVCLPQSFADFSFHHRGRGRDEKESERDRPERERKREIGEGERRDDEQEKVENSSLSLRDKFNNSLPLFLLPPRSLPPQFQAAGEPPFPFLGESFVNIGKPLSLPFPAHQTLADTPLLPPLVSDPWCRSQILRSLFRQRLLFPLWPAQTLPRARSQVPRREFYRRLVQVFL